MVHSSRAVDLVKKYGATVIAPGYRLAFIAPYPAAAEDCYDALLYLKNHSDDLKINRNQIMVGGESAGGGLCAALCMMARDRGEVRIAYQMPLYPMIDNFDTESSADRRRRRLTAILRMRTNTILQRMNERLFKQQFTSMNLLPYMEAEDVKEIALHACRFWAHRE